MAASRALYEAMAAEIKGHVGDNKDHDRANGVRQIASLVKDLVPVLKADNRAFKADKFVRACGLQDDIAPFGY